MKIHRVALVLLTTLFASSTYALNIEWHFTNSGLAWSTTDIVVMEAVMKNTDSQTLYLGDLDTAISAASVAFGSFDAPWPDGEYEFYFRGFEVLVPNPYFGGATVPLLPGESIDFIFGEFRPSQAVTPGVFEIASADLGNNRHQNYFDSSNLFSARVGVVPAPGTATLLIFGLLGLGWVRDWCKTGVRTQ